MTQEIVGNLSKVGPDGRYELVRMVGRGAMGVVFLARDTVIGRDVALKTFSFARTAENAVFRARLLREARTAGGLSHPNIVTVHDVFEEGGSPYIAMEYVEGVDLLTHMQRHGRVKPRQAIPIAAEVAEALDYAHGKGVIHRDIKPANIILAVDRRPKITDFGIACAHQSTLSTIEHFLGTPNYMAPEQIETKPSDHRADLFSLGVVLFEMLTGQRPFPGNNILMVARQIVEQQPPLASSLVEGVPPEVSLVIDKLLQKDPDQRYVRGSDVSRDLRLAMNGVMPEAVLANRTGAATLKLREPGVARSGWRSALAGAARRGLRLLNLAVTTALVSAALGAAAYATILLRDEPPPPSDPRLERLRETLPHLLDGRRLYRVGRYEDAQVAFERALALSPEREGIRSLRDRAAQEARAAAEVALAAELQGGEEAPAVPAAQRRAPVRPLVAIDVAVLSELPSGTVSVFLGDRELFERSFDFEAEKPGLWRRLIGARGSWQIGATRFVGVGEADLRVVWRAEKEERQETRLKADLEKGDQPVLDIRVDRRRGLEATLSFQ